MVGTGLRTAVQVHAKIVQLPVESPDAAHPENCCGGSEAWRVRFQNGEGCWFGLYQVTKFVVIKSSTDDGNVSMRVVRNDSSSETAEGSGDLHARTLGTAGLLTARLP